MFELYADKNKLTLTRREMVTSGSVNVHQVRFEFSPDWDGLTRTAVFKAGSESRSVSLDGNGECILPWEVLTAPGWHLMAGVYGTQGGETVLPTVWTNLGTILEGAAPGKEPQPPTPNVWEQRLEAKGDSLDYDGLNLSLMSGGKPLSTVKIAGGGGTIDHRLLSHRDEADQHPINAITGLEEALASIPVSMTADQLRKILNGV